MRPRLYEPARSLIASWERQEKLHDRAMTYHKPQVEEVSSPNKECAWESPGMATELRGGPPPLA